MTWLASGALLAAGVVALALIAAHLVSWRRPREVMLPTARFVPVEQPPAAARTRAPSDLLLLVARLLLVLLVGAAAARPVWEATAGSVRRIVVLDASGAVADPAAARDSAVARIREGDVLLVADSSVRVVAQAELAALRAGAALVMDGSLGVGRGMQVTAVLLVAQREAARLHGTVDSLSLVLVGALDRALADGATDSLRAAWPGRVELVHLAARAEHPEPRAELVSNDDDPLAVALEGAGGVQVRARPTLDGSAGDTASRPVRVVRGALTSGDSAFAAKAGATLVHWPRGAATAAFPARDRPDTVGALVLDGHAIVAPFARRREPGSGAAVAHWVDGEPAATERAHRSGCIRSVAVDLAEAGDLPLRPAFRAVARDLVRPCGAGTWPGVVITDERLARLAGGGSLAPASAFAATGANAHSTIAPWLWGAALLVALGLALWEALLEPRWRTARPAAGTGSATGAPQRGRAA